MHASAAFRPPSLLIVLTALVAVVQAPVARGGAYKVYSSYLWHLEQPNYWPEQAQGLNRTMLAYEHLSGSPTYPGHPENNIAEIFGKDDRTAVYQYRARDTVSALLYLPDAGAQLAYSGCLIENIRSLGERYSTGYGPDWNAPISQAVRWTTSRGRRRLEPLGFPYHHAFAPLIDRDALRMEIAVNKDVWWKTWLGHDYTSGQPHPRGFRCSEEAFSERIIKDLVEAGYEWVIVPNHHLSRTHPNYVQLHGKGLYDPPNRADRISPPNAGGWYSGEIDGRGSTESVPFSFQPHWAKYVDPASGQEYRIVVVPMTDLGSYRDGYSQQGIDLLHLLNGYATHERPCMALFSHDGDNAWGGGYSYYGEAVPAFCGQAAAAGYRPTTIQTFLDENPPPSWDLVHVEDGAWFNAADDWGHPQFWNWLWYPQRNRASPAYRYDDVSTWADIEGGWSEDFRNWAVVVAAQNHVSTADRLERTRGSGRVDSWRIQNPIEAGANAAELAWHFYLAGLNSGYMYYGASLDMEVKPSLACNRAIAYARQVTDGQLAHDQTPPTVFVPQRYPWNPGSTNYGAAYGYRQWVAPSDFHVWTLVHDLSGVASVTLRVRVDGDGHNPLDNNDNETYAGGASVGAWQSFPMNRRPGSEFAGNIFGSPEINFFIMPDAIADQYWFRVTGYQGQLLDYYVEAVDGRGNTRRTDIQHVYVGSRGGGVVVAFSPTAPTACDALTVTYNPVGRALEGVSPIYQAIDYGAAGPAVTSAMVQVSGGSAWVKTNAIPGAATNATVRFQNAAGTVRDDNGGAGWSVVIRPCASNEPPSAWTEPASPQGCVPVTVVYNPGSGPLAGGDPVYVHIGRNGWETLVSPDPAMALSNGVWRYTYACEPGTAEINFVFHDGGGVWDNNGGRDWSTPVVNCGGGDTGIWLAEGSPGISADPPDGQNVAGVDRFDFNPSGGDAVTVNQGGFGTFGHVYANYDAANLYLGAIGGAAGGSNNAMVVFVGINTLPDDAGNLWSVAGLPQGLDRMHNVGFDPPMDVAIVLGDEYGDGTFTNFSLGDGYNFGQGVFYLSQYGAFTPVAGARLAQYDGEGTSAVAAGDDDGNRLTERWECAIPWASLGAADVLSVTSLWVCGVLANSSTNGQDRYLSGNYLGRTASGSSPQDAYGNYGFGFVQIAGLRIGLPHEDADGDGLPDGWELRHFGDATQAAASADNDGDGLDNASEYALGTNPRNPDSRLRITAIAATGTFDRVSWTSVGGKRYRIERSPDLLRPEGGFTAAVEAVEGDVPAGVEATESSALPSGGSPAYYRVRLAP